MLAIVWWLALAVTVAGLCYLLLAMASVASFRAAAPGEWAEPPRVTVLKPLCGDEAGLDAAIRSFLAQETRSPLRFVFGVADARDPALAIARSAAQAFPGVRTEFVTDASAHGLNPKVGNLINMARTGLEEIVVLSDSDVAIGEGVLQRAIDALAPANAGAATALYRSLPGVPGDRWRRFGAWFLDYWFLPMAVLHARLTPLSVTYGPLTAIKRDVLERIGGLGALADHLSDDAELGRLVRAAGFDVVFSPDPVETLVNDTSHAELFGHELRWARTVRGLDPLGFVASVVSHPGPLPLLLLLYPSLGVAGCIAALPVLRWWLVRMVERKFGRAACLPKPGLLSIWLRDCYCFAVWIAAFAVGRVGWRGQQLAVERRGQLRPVAERTP